VYPAPDVCSFLRRSPVAGPEQYHRTVATERATDRGVSTGVSTGVSDAGVADRGVTHIALPVRDLDASLDFYERFADMRVVHRRADPGGNPVAWISDLTRPFVLVLIQTATAPSDSHCLGGPFCHVGMAVASRAEVDQKCELARAEGRPVIGPNDYGPPVGYWAYVVDPDGHNLEISHGQEVAFTVDRAATSSR
jgi:catechol 2,3-dioxygenase-like lactoylglutathione lyase family enzyme